jgi:hypothetical protein
VFDPAFVAVDGLVVAVVVAVVVDGRDDEACDDELEQPATATQHTIVRLATSPCLNRVLLNDIGTPIATSRTDRMI